MIEVAVLEGIFWNVQLQNVRRKMNTSCRLTMPKILPVLATTNIMNYYPTALRRVQITPKTSTNITRYLYSRGPARQVFSQRASDELD